ncbi:homoserine dehydrogenase [bacterium]|nr:homoserine dehydrogenase [bacterium]
MNKINVGLIGLGTVGSGVVKTLRNFEYIQITKIAVKSMGKKRNIENLDESMLTTDAFSIVNDPNVDIVVEVIGGVNPAFDLIKTAIMNKKHVVTANKELLAKHGEELFKLASENNVVILYEAAVGGGIPIIMPVKMTLSVNRIDKIAAILNGTTNYILTKMDEEGADYAEVLAEAQKLGYAETDPTGDVEGFDAAYKIATLATIAFKKRVNIKNIHREGITKISARDMAYAKQLGYKIKLIALAQMDGNDADVRVHPMLVKSKHTLAHINGVTNAVMLAGEPIGQIVLSGPGAGEFPTASSVVGDIVTICSELNKTDVVLPMMRCTHKENANPVSISDTKNKYYILFNVNNEPGVIGTIGAICGKHNINLASLLQQDIDDGGDVAEVVVITAKCLEADVQDAIRELEANSCIVKSLIRVME